MKRFFLASVTAMTMAVTSAASADAPASAPASASASASAPAPAPAPVPASEGTLLATRPSPPKPLELASKSEGTSFWTKLFALLGIGAACAFLWHKKKRSARAGKPAASIDVLGRTGLGMRSELVVVEVEGTRLLVGMTPSAITTLAVLETPDGAGELASAAPEEALAGRDRDRPRTLLDDLEPRATDIGTRVRSLLGAGEEPVMPRLSPPSKAEARAKPAPGPAAAAAARPARAPRTRAPRSTAIAGQARGLLLSDEDT